MKDFRLTFTSLTECIRQIQELFKNNPAGVYVLNIVERGKKRSLSANNQQHRWYAEISKSKGDITALDAKNFCKDTFGLPLVLNSPIHGDKMEFLLDKLGYYKHSYESRMKLIQCLEVTSLLSTAESKIFMDQMIFYWNENGVPIKFKD